MNHVPDVGDPHAPTRTPGPRRPTAGAGPVPPAAPAHQDAEPPPAAPAHQHTEAGRLAAAVERLRAEVRDAQNAADGRALVEMAKGVLMGRLGCGPAEAAHQLATLAERSGTEPLELAVEVINEAAGDRVSQIATEFLARAAQDHADESRTTALRLRSAESRVLASPDARSVAAALLENALAPLGATGVAIWLANADSSLSLVGQAGFTEEEAARWRYVPPEVATCARLALSGREPAFIASLADGGLPTIGRRRHPEGARLAVPAGTGGRIIGVVEVAWPQPQPPQPPRIVRQIEALAELCARTLDDACPTPYEGPAHAPRGTGIAELADLSENLHDPALILTPLLDSRGHLADFRIHHANARFVDPAGRPTGAVVGSLFLEAYAFAEADGLFEKIERVHATGEPLRTERMSLTAVVDQVPLTSFADIGISRHGEALLLLWRVEDETARLASLLGHAQRLGRVGGFEESVVSGRITWNGQLFALYGLPPSSRPVPLRDLPAHAHPDDSIAITRFLRTLLHHRREASIDLRLRRPDGITRHVRIVAEPALDSQGVLHAVRGAYQDISSQHWTEVALAATRDRLAHSEAETVERTRLTLQLQHAIMPLAPAPLEVPGMRVAVRYRPAEEEALVGGDWYDATVLPSRSILLCVGDVAGHGIEAATGMVILRNALRGLAVTGAGPAQLLTWLNAVAHHLTDQVTATAVCGIYDPVTRVLRWARAGHLPPVLVRRGAAEVFPLTGGLLLGALPETVYTEQEIQLEPDDTLLMYTDGLVERRDTSVAETLSHLIAVAAQEAPSLEGRLDHLLTYSRSDTDDDTCLIGIQVR
ncbi:SpoIIE family protein phosphatase [Streptomyces sp. NPDC029003]|uniref:SpoIIE family protein phosphatase n=1 Tax=Streptomyces sp. NPDC029003 TaxID=3155125 RepID=UPI00340DC9EF